MDIRLPNGQIGRFPDDMRKEEIEAVLRKQFPAQQEQKVAAQNTQDMGQSSAAPAKEDDLGAYLDQLPNPSNQSFLSKLPRNILTGLAHAGRNLHNLPHDIMQYAQELTPLSSLVETKTGKKLADYLPEDVQNYSDVFGINPEGATFGDRAIQTALEHIPDFMGLGGAGRALGRVFPITKGLGARQLKEAQKLVNERGLSVPIPPEILQEVLPFFPKTHATNELLTQASAGHYPSSFGVQSELGRHERALGKSSSWAERNLLAPQASELKKRIVSHFETTFREAGHDDIADFLKGGLNDYRRYIQFRDKALPIMKKLGIATTGLGILESILHSGKKVASTLSEE